MQQKTTQRLVRVISDIAPSLARKLDAEVANTGLSRAAVIRLALIARYQRNASKNNHH